MKLRTLAIGMATASAAIMAVVPSIGGGDAGASVTRTDSVSTASALSAASCTKIAKARAAVYEKPLVFKAPAPAFSIKKAAGESVWVIEEISELPVSVNLNAGISAAAKAAGIKVTFFDGENTPATESTGVSEAVARGAKAIVLEGVEPEDVEASLQTAYAAHIPVLDDWNTDPNAPLNGEYAHVTFQYTAGGKALADYVLAQTGCKADVVTVNTPGLTSINDANAGEEKEFKSLCSTCTVHVDSILLANLNTGLASSVTNDIQSDPKVNWVVCVFDAAAQLVVPAIQSAGLKGKVQVAGHDGSAPNIAYVRAGNTQVEDMTIGPPTLQGWITMDQVGRALLGLAPSKDDIIPQQILTTQDITKSGNLFPSFGNFEAGFEKDWGIK
jgi:ribose transport system substrate-binding protein